MGHPQSKWKNKRYKARTYVGRYAWKAKARFFVLTALLRSGKTHSITLESHEHARTSGWKKYQ